LHGYFQYCYENETTEDTVFDVEPFGHDYFGREFSAERLKAEWLKRNEEFSVVRNIRLMADA
jgi:hypothetical protein